MSTLNDLILASVGGVHLVDGLREFYLANGAISGTLNDLELQYLRSVFPAGGAESSINDLWMNYLNSLGYSGTLNDRLFQFWSEMASAWSPLALFAAGEQGVWYDPSDLSTMFKDVAGTVPVTADGDLVARINDKSGNGNHATQATEAARPLYKTSGGLHWLQFDGTDDSLRTAAIDFLGADKISVFTAAYKASDAARTAICALGGATQGFRLYGSNPAGNANVAWEAGGSIVTAINSSNAAPATRVLTGLCDISGDSSTLRVNGTSTASAADRGSGVFSTAAITVAARSAADLPLNGYVYGLIVRNVLSVAAEITAAESYMAGKSGVTL